MYLYTCIYIYIHIPHYIKLSYICGNNIHAMFTFYRVMCPIPEAMEIINDLLRCQEQAIDGTHLAPVPPGRWKHMENLWQMGFYCGFIVVLYGFMVVLWWFYGSFMVVLSWFYGMLPSSKLTWLYMENHNFLWGKSTISMANFNSKLSIYQRANGPSQSTLKYIKYGYCMDVFLIDRVQVLRKILN